MSYTVLLQVALVAVVAMVVLYMMYYTSDSQKSDSTNKMTVPTADGTIEYDRESTTVLLSSTAPVDLSSSRYKGYVFQSGAGAAATDDAVPVTVPNTMYATVDLFNDSAYTLAVTIADHASSVYTVTPGVNVKIYILPDNGSKVIPFVVY